MKTIYLITLQTFINIYKTRVFYSSLFSAALLLLITFVAAEFTYNVTEKVVVDVGVAIAVVTTNILGVFLGVSLIYDEVENRTLYMILSRPVKRSIFIFSKILALVMIIIVNACFLLSLTTLLYFHYGGEWSHLMMTIYFFTCLETIFLTLFAVLFSLFTQKIVAILVCLSLWFMGHACVPLQNFTLVKENMLLNFLVDRYVSYGPNLYKINVRNFISYDIDLSSEFVLNATLYTFAWFSLLLIIITIVFQNKELT